MEKLLFTELRVLNRKRNGYLNKYTSETDLQKAFIDNENLKALGYTLKGEGIVELAKDYSQNPEMTPLYARVKEFEPGIEVSPMYPNFPIQVLEMGEIEFRSHQLLHYLTTYGMESYLTHLNVEVAEGWLPETEVEMERISDEQIADLKTLDYLTPQEINDLVIDDLIGRNERLLPNELSIAKSIVGGSLRQEITNIPFKENIGLLYGDVLLNGKLNARYAALAELAGIIKHPGDVLDLVEHLVVINKYKHFKTSLKRGLVELFESFSAAAIEENLASHRWSSKFLGKGGRKRSLNRNIMLIDYLSFSKFSKNNEAMNLVNELKDGKLSSWNQRLERAYDKKDYGEVLSLLTQRPGVYFRQIGRLCKLGVPLDIVSKHMKELAAELKTQSIVSALNNYSEDANVVKVFYDTLIANLSSKEIESIAGKKIYIETSDVSFDKSKIEITDRMEEGGYIQNGIAVKIPEDAKYLRFFTYWNDERRVDIDLHAAYSYHSTPNEVGHIGWNGDYKNDGLVYSGDITHSDAAEYIDIDLEEARESDIDKVQFNINSYTTIPFKNIDTVFTGLMVLGEMGKKVELYDHKNVVFRHDLENNSMALNYGVLDLKDNTFSILGTNSHRHNDRDLVESLEPTLSMKAYLNILIGTQKACVVDNREDADLVVGLAKSDEENYISLLDENFFMGQ